MKGSSFKIFLVGFVSLVVIVRLRYEFELFQGEDENLVLNQDQLKASNLVTSNPKLPKDIANKISLLQSRLNCKLHYSKGNELNLFATASGEKYEDMIPMYAFMALSSHSAVEVDATVEMRVPDSIGFVERHWKSLSYILDLFGNHSICVGSFSAETMSLTGVSNTWRYIEAPIRRWSKYTYIGDIDIFLTESVLAKERFEQMKYFNLSYSNVIRPKSERLTGVMLLDTKRFYNNKLLELQRNTSWLKNQIKYDNNDEMFLYYLAKTAGLGLPATYNSSDRMTFYRPLHGLHFSNNRGPFRTLCLLDLPIQTILDTPNFKSFLQIDSSENGHSHFLYEFIGKMSLEKAWKMKDIKNTCQTSG